MAAGAVFVALACSSGLAVAAPSKRWSPTDPMTTGLTWGSCTNFGMAEPDPNLSCGYYEVPMDYFDSTAGKARLALVKYQATVPNKKGTLFTNPGGPGGSGFELLSVLGAEISANVQGQYDIISWDPRGVGSYTFPGDVICFNTSTEEAAFWDNTVVRSINETISTKFSDPKELAEFYSRVAETEGKLEAFGKKCLESKSGPYLKYIGTSSTIRDLVSLADKIVGPGKPIDYYGYSYGTAIGFHFLTLFSDRVGHVVLDGVEDPIKWGSYDSNSLDLVDSEAVFTGFANSCAKAGGNRCLLAGMIKGIAVGSDVSTLVTSTIDLALKLQRVGYLGLQPAELKASIFRGLYFARNWQVVANQLIYPTLTTLLKAGRAHGFTDPYILPQTTVESPLAINSDTPRSYPVEAISGADGVASNGVPLKNAFDDLVKITRDHAPTFGAVWTGLSTTPKWPVRSVEPLPAFTRKTLSNRILIIGNTFDLTTPFRSAKYVAQLLGSENAVLLENQAVGHTTVSQTSACTKAIVSNYLLNSTLPQQDTKCAADSFDFFPGNTTSVRRSLWRK